MKQKVYRLEDVNGNGPFHGDQRVVHVLRPHNDPDRMMKTIGYPKAILEVLSKAGFVFGWRNKELYKKFFKKKGQQFCEINGFTCRIYEPELRFIFPDGQVIFSRNTSIVTPTLRDLLVALSKYPPSSKG